MPAAAVVFVIVFVVLPIVLVTALFVWAAIRDGREDREIRARLRNR